ncbi:hypothetical protein [Acinetobacter nosocomialis]|uniref:hypothetical protein n=1 Tax=Acinetobacter nosocomialis TaxID=106654 RepID=UPI00125D52BB|nr:hypothetical protein [Acinetobacter nosocomialis]
MTCEQYISIAANLMTIIGGLLAFYVFYNWKKQENYSFTRDKIFECEVIYARLLTSIQNYIEIYKEEVPFSPNRLNKTNLELTNVLLAEVRKTIDPLWNEYELSLYSLRVLEVNYNIEKLPNFIALNGQMKRYIDFLNKTETKEQRWIRKFEQHL